MENREIKFRSYNKSFHQMYYYTLGECITDGRHAEFANNVMQYTGLKDKSGKEIYEGDIVGGYPHGTVSVRWCNEYACFEAYWSDLEYDEQGEESEKEQTSLFANEFRNCKDAWTVLGNIYETPELLLNGYHPIKKEGKMR